jgi:hypothetical protein
MTAITFNKIPGNAAVFIDANIFIYHFTPDPVLGPECQIAIDGRVDPKSRFRSSASACIIDASDVSLNNVVGASHDHYR